MTDLLVVLLGWWLAVVLLLLLAVAAASTALLLVVVVLRGHFVERLVGGSLGKDVEGLRRVQVAGDWMLAMVG